MGSREHVSQVVMGLCKIRLAAQCTAKLRFRFSRVILLHRDQPKEVLCFRLIGVDLERPLQRLLRLGKHSLP